MPAPTTSKAGKQPAGAWQSVFLAVVVAAGAIVLAYVAIAHLAGSRGRAEPAARALALEDIPFDGARAYGYLQELCDLGVRPSGSEGMEKQRELVAGHFRRLGGRVSLEEFRARHPLDGSAVPMANLLVEWHPQKAERILLAAHYDTRPYPDRDPARPRGTFLGANDGASGVALLMELAETVRGLDGRYGVDFVLFDGEEFVFRDRSALHAGDPYFLGSEHFARKYLRSPPGHRYRWAVVLDMIGDADLQIYYERNSISWRDTRGLVLDLWRTAERLGVREFVPCRGFEIRDDHLALRNIAKIPACNVIDFDYPHWHKESDTPDKCSALSLAKVGWVVSEWLQNVMSRDED